MSIFVCNGNQLARVYDMNFQLPDHKLTTTALSPAAVVILLPAFGRIMEVALYVSVSMPVNVNSIHTPAWTVPKDEMVVVPVIFTELPVAAESAGVAEAISLLWALSKRPVSAPPVKFNLAVSSRANSAFKSSIISPTSFNFTLSPASKLKAVFVSVVAV